MSGMNFDAEIEKYMQEKHEKTGKGEYDAHGEYQHKLMELKERTSSGILLQKINYSLSNHNNMSSEEMDKNYAYLKSLVDGRDGGCGRKCKWAIIASIVIVLIIIIVVIVLYVKHKKSKTPILQNTEKFNTVRSDRLRDMNDLSSSRKNESFGAFVERGPSVTYPDPYIKYNYYDDSYDKNQSQFDDKFCGADDDSEDSMQDNYSVGRIVQPQYL